MKAGALSSHMQVIEIRSSCYIVDNLHLHLLRTVLCVAGVGKQLLGSEMRLTHGKRKEGDLSCTVSLIGS